MREDLGVEAVQCHRCGTTVRLIASISPDGSSSMPWKNGSTLFVCPWCQTKQSEPWIEVLEKRLLDGSVDLRDGWSLLSDSGTNGRRNLAAAVPVSDDAVAVTSPVV